MRCEERKVGVLSSFKKTSEEKDERGGYSRGRKTAKPLKILIKTAKPPIILPKTAKPHELCSKTA